MLIMGPSVRHRGRVPQRWMTLGVMFMGLGGVVAGLVGVALPEGHRLGAVFALIAGAGTGLAFLAVGALFRSPPEPSEFTFFIASLAGFLTVCAASWWIWRRTEQRRAAGADRPG
jgi:drug/metabolite transporter (DMT)-like permease